MIDLALRALVRRGASGHAASDLRRFRRAVAWRMAEAIRAHVAMRALDAVDLPGLTPFTGDLREVATQCARSNDEVFGVRSSVRFEAIAAPERLRYSSVGELDFLLQRFLAGECGRRGRRVECEVWATRGARRVRVTVHVRPGGQLCGKCMALASQADLRYSGEYDILAMPPPHPFCRCLVAPVLQGFDESDSLPSKALGA